MSGKNRPVKTGTLTLHWKEPLTIEVERKRIRNMYLHVKSGGRVVISAPLCFTDDEIASFAATRADWIEKQLKTVPVTERRQARFETGDTLYLWGEAHTLTFLPDKTASLSFRENAAVLTMPAASSRQAREKFVAAQMKLRFTRAVAMRLPYWEKETGLYARGFHVRDMKSRWGVCDTATKKLTFNLRLVELDPKYLDYIIVHELTHLKHRMHDEAFWNAVETYLPDCKTTRRQLNRAETDLWSIA